ncbi:glycosyl hydrolase family 18 protein [Corallococcus sp. AS-1-6]|uniref:glycosyl hydrolase family 18 protein n=1 Tax=Corallococcus sp. AS-1-6 TaxID=2874599 RepID=UPI001CC0706C|nr:glycosyl hydrolase family 18 protein [Corallococcus sp. AS-1-6]MBZ4372745.1 chitinase [Corallococcus sp. AS-1-6]
MQREARTWFLVALTLILLTRSEAGAQPLEEQARPRTPNAVAWIYQDRLTAPWKDTSTAKHSLSATAPVFSGSFAISVTMEPSEALSFSHPGLDVTASDTFTLKVHGGEFGEGATVRVRAVANATQHAGLLLGDYCEGGRIQARKWVTCHVPLAKLLPAGTSRIKGLWLQETLGKPLPTLYFDDLRVESSGTTPPQVVVTVSPTQVELAPGAAYTFQATVTGSTDTSVTWELDPQTGSGTITSGGVYTAPTTQGTYGVVARSRADPTKFARATAWVHAIGGGSGKWVSGYYTGWNADEYPPEKVDFSALTHILVGRATPRPDGTLNTQFDNDNGPAIARLLAQRAHAAGRKALIMVGGSGEHEGWVGAASDANRAKFVQALLKAVDDFGYDGLDLNWEPVELEDRLHLLALVQTLRAARPGLLLTFPIHWINTNFPEDAAPWYAELALYLDQVNVMSYSMVGPWDGWVSWYTSALRGESGQHPTSIESSLALWAAAGIPKAKLGIGIPFYGMGWRNITGPYQPFTDWSDYVGGDNSFTYKNILAWSVLGTHHWDDAAQAEYLTFPPNTPIEDGTVRWISYDGPQAIAAKGAFVKQQGYGGTIIWTINQGCTDPETGANPLLDAVKGALLQ